MDGRPLNRQFTIKLRKAARPDIALLRYWDEQPHRKESDPNADWQWETEVDRACPWRQQLIAELDDHPIGYVEILHCAMDEEHYWGDVPETWAAIDIWIGEETNIARGYGTQMLRAAVAICFSREDIETVVLDPIATNIRARKFYERNGFKLVEERWFGEDHCAVYRLNRHAWEDMNKN
jgi:aminoglycoside 6'-N-acetyltransferase